MAWANCSLGQGLRINEGTKLGLLYCQSSFCQFVKGIKFAEKMDLYNFPPMLPGEVSS
jgi:hypothetical protein